MRILLAPATALALLAACTTSAEIPVDATISCEQDGVCPDGRTCHPALKKCLLLGVAPPAPTVVFVAPRDDEKGVSLSPQIVIAFSLDVDFESAAARAHLTRADGTEVPLVATKTGRDSTVSFSAKGLASKTSYTFTLDAGVEPLKGSLALPSVKPFTSTFETAEALDTTPPAPVSSIEIDRVSASRAELRWKAPTDDFAGVLILRTRGGPVTGVPENHHTYAAGAQVGDAVVLTSTREDRFSDVTLTAEAYGYAFFAVDEFGNYSPATRAPFVSELALTWCPSGSGTFQLVRPGSESGTQQLRVISGATTAGYPAIPANLGEVTPITPDAVLALGGVYSVRGVASNASGATLTIPRPFTLSKASLAPLSQPLAIGLGGTASFGFDAYAWPAFEGQVDSDPAPGVESFVATGVTVGAASVSAPFASAGSYRLRVRPVVSGCVPDAPWVTSDEFQVGSGVWYVAPGGSGPGNDPQHPLATISAAISASTPGPGANDLADIQVAGGTYNEAITLKAKVRLFGGYSADFRSRDPAPLDASLKPLAGTGFLHVSTLAPSGNPGAVDNVPVRAADPAMRSTTVLDGFTIRPTGTGPADTRGVSLEGGASPLLRNNHVLGGVPPAGFNSAGVYVGLDSSATLEGNWVEAQGGATAPAAAVLIDDCSAGAACRATLKGNRLLGHYAVRVKGNGRTFLQQGLPVPSMQPSFNGNWIEADQATPHGFNSTAAFLCDTPSVLTVSHNQILGRPSFAGQLNNSTGIELRNCAGTFDGNLIEAGVGVKGFSYAVSIRGLPANTSTQLTNNVIDAGDCSYFSRAIDLDAASPIQIVNNVIFAGSNATSDQGAFYFGGGYNASAESQPRSALVVNNIIFGSGKWKAVEENVRAPASLQNNVFLSPLPTIFEHTSTGADLTSVAAVESFNCGKSLRAQGNVASTLTAADVFVSAGGADGKLETALDNDWRLKTADKSLTEGGLDASQSLCGGGTFDAAQKLCLGAGTDSCGAVTVDRDAKPRTVPYSLGAYEAP